ncbi:hypothetical protein BD410DRAFT_893460 [Rickenella mellea]|uniref:DNA polymerase n=1 Tax=Rickenella mellea TaxID=50990 RepID=A0A4Y7QLF5_9AGAM|nr:hypothetical protein BD410DRAFT_893460 [Rickenella mellea]
MEETRTKLRVRINHIDYSLAKPGPLDNSALHRVPIIRIYGTSSSGQEACVHIHQVYPYFFLEYLGPLDASHVEGYIGKLSVSLNHAIALSLRRNPLSHKSHFVRGIVLVKGVHFYGFHASFSPFLKIAIVDPAVVTRAVTILQSGTVMGTRFKTYENHLSYFLQFMCDFNLYGCNWLDLGEVWQRGQDQPNQQDDNLEEIPVEMFKKSPHYCQSRVGLEVDVEAHQILNRHSVFARNWHDSLTIPAPPPPSEPLIHSVRELWEDERQRRIARGQKPSPDKPSDPSERSRGSEAHWVAEARWWNAIIQKIEAERDVKPMVAPTGWEMWVMTTFESVEAFWEENRKTWKASGAQENTGLKNPYAFPDNMAPFVFQAGESGESEGVDVDVDEKLLSSEEISKLMEIEESEWIEKDSQRNLDGLDGDEIDETDDPEVYDEDLDAHDNSPAETTEPSESTPPVPLELTQGNCTAAEPPELRGSDDNLHSQTSGTISPHKLKNPYVSPWDSKHQEVPSPNDSSPARRPQMNPTSSASVSSGIVPTLPLAAQLPNSNPDQSNGTGNIPALLAADNRNGKRRVVFASSYEKQEIRDGVQLPTDNSLEPAAFQHDRQCATRLTSNSFLYARPTPSKSELVSTVIQHGLPSKIYRNPFYSEESDAPDNPREHAGLLYTLKGGDGPSSLESWIGVPEDTDDVKPSAPSPNATCGWEYSSHPPTVAIVKRWLNRNRTQLKRRSTAGQITGRTKINKYGFETSPEKASESATRETNDMTVLSLEVLALSRGNLLPDPGIDKIVAVFISFQGHNCRPLDNDNRAVPYERQTIVVQSPQTDPQRIRDFRLQIVLSELDLLNTVVDRINEFDPDILAGWEVQRESWGYLNARASTFGFDIGELISRAPGRQQSVPGTHEYASRHTSTFRVIGRHVFNVWRIMRASQTLNNYSFENVAFHLLRRRIPRYSNASLTEWYSSVAATETLRVLRYVLHRTTLVLEMLDKSEIITQNAEFARVFGVDFFSVLSRGSQFKVESFMFRIAKPENFVLPSPSKSDVGKQNAAECIPLIMEPLSAFYSSPLLVLDFQSLYPSVMIAYNYCYSTCLGRARDFKGQNKIGVVDLLHPPGLLESVKEHLFVAPNGIVYVKPAVRTGLLGRMLNELLDTRVMVKHAMKGLKGHKALHRILEARQLSLKFICNVTYGYTSASYSGRMPAVEIADSIVQSGRETLERAIRVIDSTTKWDAKVVYGDTDSVFVYLHGRTKEQAFRIGNDIADTITRMNPAPVRLKFEKVYLPCILIAKKRYVGFKYETPDEKEPVFDAKGIETVRRDGVAAQAKMTENSLKILFRSQDLSQVKAYCYRSWLKLIDGKASVQDFIFAKEVKMGTYNDKLPPPPGVAIAARRLLVDPNDEAQYGDRVPYVIVRGEPESRLVDRAVAPLEFLNNRHMSLDVDYYISRVLIPPLERIFNLVGADVRCWYDDMPRSLRVEAGDPESDDEIECFDHDYLGIHEHFYNSQCLLCGGPTMSGLCWSCHCTPETTTADLYWQLEEAERQLLTSHQVCAGCTQSRPVEPIKCDSLDCPWLFRRKTAEENVEHLSDLSDVVQSLGHPDTFEWEC